jgi:hypothetical protein
MRLAHSIGAAFASLQGEARRQLLMLTTLYFSILFLESEVSHIPLLSAGWWNLALLPVIWLAVSLLTLMAALLWPSASTSRFLQVAMLGAAVVGVVGVFPHLEANGVTLNQLGALLNGSVFRGEPGPQWPLAITIGAALGFIGANGIAGDLEFRRGSAGWAAVLAFVVLVVGIALSYSLTTLGWGATAIVASALLLLAISLVRILSVMAERRAA